MSAYRLSRRAMRILPLLAVFALTGCRDIRVQTLAVGTTTVLGTGNEIVVVRDDKQLDRLGIKAPMNFRSEFGVVLLMGPHHRSGFRQVIESVRAGDGGFRAVAFEEAPPDGGEPSRDYRTYTLFIAPNSAYMRGFHLEVVTPSNDPVASGVLP